MDVETSRNILEGALEAFDVGVEFTDMVLKPLDPSLLLGNTLVAFLLAIVDKLCNVVGQSFILHVVDVGEGGTDSSDDAGARDRACKGARAGRCGTAGVLRKPGVPWTR